MMSLSADKDKDAEIQAFNSTFRYLDGQLNIDNTYFDSIAEQIYPSELQLNKAIPYWGPVSAFTFDYFRWFCFFQNLW